MLSITGALDVQCGTEDEALVVAALLHTATMPELISFSQVGLAFGLEIATTMHLPPPPQEPETTG